MITKKEFCEDMIEAFKIKNGRDPVEADVMTQTSLGLAMLHLGLINNQETKDYLESRAGSFYHSGRHFITFREMLELLPDETEQSSVEEMKIENSKQGIKLKPITIKSPQQEENPTAIGDPREVIPAALSHLKDEDKEKFVTHDVLSKLMEHTNWEETAAIYIKTPQDKERVLKPNPKAKKGIFLGDTKVINELKEEFKQLTYKNKVYSFTAEILITKNFHIVGVSIFENKE